jgi:hypothetical protein
MDDDVPATMLAHATMRDMGLALDIIAAPMALEVMHHLFHGGRIADLETDDNRADLAHALTRLVEIGVVDTGDADARLTGDGRELWRAYEQVALRRAGRART